MSQWTADSLVPPVSGYERRPRGGRCRRSSRRAGSSRPAGRCRSSCRSRSRPAARRPRRWRASRAGTPRRGPRVPRPRGPPRSAARSPRPRRRAGSTGSCSGCAPSAESSTRAGEDLAGGHVALAVGVDPRAALDAEREVGALGLDPQLAARSRAARSAAPAGRCSSPHAATGSSRSRNSARSTSAAKSPVDMPACCAPGRRRPHRPAPAALQRDVADRRPACARRAPAAPGRPRPARSCCAAPGSSAGSPSPRRRRARRARASRGGRRAPPPSSPRSGRAAPPAAPATPRARGSRAGARAAAASPAWSSARAPAGPPARRGSSRHSSVGEAPRVRRQSIDDRRRAAPAGGGAGHLDRQAGDGEAGRARERAEVVELLDLAVLVVDAGAVRLPQDRGVAGRSYSARSAMNGRSRPQASVPITFTPRSSSHVVDARVSPEPALKYSAVSHFASAPVHSSTMS